MSQKKRTPLENRIWEHPFTIFALIGGIGVFVAGLWGLYLYRWFPFIRNVLVASKESCLTFAALFNGYPLIGLVLLVFVLLGAGLATAVYRVFRKFQIDRKIESKQTILRRSSIDDPKLKNVLDSIYSKTGFRAQTYLIKSKKPVCLVQGLFRPSIIVSTAILNRLSDDELEAAMLHEISHLKTKDPLKRLVVEFVADWLFFIPMIRRLSVHLGYLQELLADSYASRVSGKPVTLASAIVKIASTEKLGLASSLGQVHLTKRVKRLLGERHRTTRRVGILSVAVSLMFIATIIITPFAIGSETVVKHNKNACAKQCLESAGKGQASACVKDCAKGVTK